LNTRRRGEKSAQRGKKAEKTPSGKGQGWEHGKKKMISGHKLKVTGQEKEEMWGAPTVGLIE